MLSGSPYCFPLSYNFLLCIHGLIKLSEIYADVYCCMC